MPTPSDEELAIRIGEALAAWDAAKRRGADAAELEALSATLGELVDERERRQAEELDLGLEAGGVLLDGADDTYGDRELHEKRRAVLERWARELGLPFDLPPGTDLSDDEIFDEIQTDLYSYQEMLDELAKQPPPTPGSKVGGMDSVDRVIEAFKRAIDSGRIDDAAIEQLKQMLNPEALKWLPLLLGLGLGVGLLSGGWAIAAGLILAYGKSVYDLGKALYHVVNARDDAEYDDAVEELIQVLGGVGADLLISLGSFVGGLGFRYLRGKPSGTRPPAGGSTRRRPPRETPTGPRRMVPRPRGRSGIPDGIPRKRPPWLDPEGAPRVARRLSPNAASMPRGPAGGAPSPRRPGRPRPRGKPPEIEYGPTGGHDGVTTPDGRIVISDRLRPSELGGVVRHELAHRMVRPHRYRARARARLARRIGRLLTTSHVVKFLDEVHAYARQIEGRLTPSRFRHEFRQIITAPGFLAQYGVNPARLRQELAFLRRQPWFRKILDNPAKFLDDIERGAIDLKNLVRDLEEFARKFDRLRARRQATTPRLP